VQQTAAIFEIKLLSCALKPKYKKAKRINYCL